LRSKGQRSRSLGTKNVKIFYRAYLRQQCIDLSNQDQNDQRSILHNRRIQIICGTASFCDNLQSVIIQEGPILQRPPGRAPTCCNAKSRRTAQCMFLSRAVFYCVARGDTAGSVSVCGVLSCAFKEVCAPYRRWRLYRASSVLATASRVAITHVAK